MLKTEEKMLYLVRNLDGNPAIVTVSKNTSVIHNDDGDIIVQLCGNNIARLQRGLCRLYVSLCNYNTRITRSRLNALFEYYAPNLRIKSNKDGSAYLYNSATNRRFVLSPEAKYLIHNSLDGKYACLDIETEAENLNTLYK